MLINCVIIHQIRAMPIYGHKVIVIRYPAICVGCQDSTEIMQNAAQPQFFSLQNQFSVGDNLLNNKTIILLNLAEYRLILANSA